jgi:hypothetical protein
MIWRLLPSRVRRRLVADAQPPHLNSRPARAYSELMGSVWWRPRGILARVMEIFFVVHVRRMYPHDAAAYVAGFRVPTHVIADDKCLDP